MGDTRRIPDAVRQAIIADARRTQGTSKGSVRQVAARHGVSQASVRRIVANESNLPGFGAPETRAKMQNGIEATKQSAADKRARLAEMFADAAIRALEDERADTCEVFNFGGKDNTFEIRRVNFVPVKERQILMTAAAIAADKHKMLDQYDSDAARGNDMDLFLRHMMGLDGAV